MRKTSFAGITRLEPGDSINEAADFHTRDRDVIDHFLRVGAVTHRHDAHVALGGPTAAPSGSVLTEGGSIPADTGIYLGYTLVDQDGGETQISPLLTLATQPAYGAPETPPRATVTYNSGAVMADTYYYAITLVDGMGGESVLGPVVSVDREPGPTFGEITLDGLTADFDVSGAVGWRLYKSRSGQNFGFFASGATDRFVDAGQGCVDCGQPPPSENRTNRTNSLLVTVPPSAGIGSASGGVGSGAAAFRLYGSRDGSFLSPALMGEFPASSAGTIMQWPALSFMDGAPPDVATTVRGAARIDANEITNLFWREAVAASGALPASERIGEARLVRNSGLVYAALGASGGASGGAGWVAVGSAGWVNRVGVASGASASRPFTLEFIPGAGVQLALASGGGSARVTISASGAGGGGGGGAPALNVGGSGQVPLLPARSYLELAGSGGTFVGLQDLGGGSARAVISASAVPGPPGPPGEGLHVRAWASATTGSLASGASAAVGVDLGQSYRLLRVNASQSSRVRVYAASADQDADAGRAVGTDPTGDHGLVLDFLPPPSDLSWRLSPQVDGSSMEDVPQVAIPVSITNHDAEGAVTVAFEFLRTE
jgi:hypothetical protein